MLHADASGIAKDATTVAQCNPSSIDFHMQANVAGNLHLFQAIYPLLEASTQPGGGVFMPISSQMGSIGDGPAFPNLAYGMSKAALNFMCKKIALEHEKIKVLIMQYVNVPVFDLHHSEHSDMRVRTAGSLTELNADML
jgi:norsolorinic acid ketoreductase